MNKVQQYRLKKETSTSSSRPASLHQEHTFEEKRVALLDLLESTDFDGIRNILLAEGFRELPMVEFITHDEEFAHISEPQRIGLQMNASDTSPC